jgi:hypothetical protein
VALESAMAAIRRDLDTASIKMSCRLPSSSGDSKLIPVMLPPGRASDATSPSATMSSLMPTSGMVRVRDCSARSAKRRSGDNYIGCSFDQSRRQFGKVLVAGLEAIRNHCEILALYKPIQMQFIE